MAAASMVRVKTVNKVHSRGADRPASEDLAENHVE